MSNPEHSMAITGVPSDMIATGIFFAFTLLIFFLIIFIMAFCLRGANEEAVSPVAPRPCSLNAVTVASLSSLTLRAADFEDGVECAVCLSELAEGEAVRKLPHCGHIFHVACIDMWFYSHCTCPLCRSAVTAEEPKVVNSSVIESADSSPITVNALDASASRGREEDEVVIIEIR